MVVSHQNTGIINNTSKINMDLAKKSKINMDLGKTNNDI